MISNYKHIFIADDDSDDIEMFQDAIDETCPGFKLTVAMDGVKLLNLLDTSPAPDAIVLDLNMPLKNGKECLKEIRAKVAFNNVPIFILSTSDRTADKDYCLAKGAKYYFVKPTSYEGMKSIVENLCNS